jgi:hypothetical protein
MDTMKTKNTLTGLIAWALLGTTSLAFTGCMTNEEKRSDYNSDGQGAFLVSETDQMGQTLGQFPAEGLAKSVASDFVISGELVINPWAYQADCGCFVRTARYTGHKGYERERVDTITFLDSAGAKMDKFRPAGIAKVIHTRNVHHEKGAHEMDVRIDITVDIKTENGGRVGVWNGTMGGSFNGQEFKSATVTQVVRPFNDGRFRFPTSGSIELTRPVHKFTVEFLGDGKAKVTIRNRLNGKIHILWIDKDYNESDPADAE